MRNLISHVTACINQAWQINWKHDMCDGVSFSYRLSQLFNSFLYIERCVLILKLAFQRHLRATCTSQKRDTSMRAYFSPSVMWIYSCVAGINQSAVSIVNVFLPTFNVTFDRLALVLIFRQRWKNVSINTIIYFVSC